MEEEVKEKKFNFKKYLPIIAAALVAIILVVVLIIVNSGKGDKDKKEEETKSNPQETVKSYIEAMDKKDVSKVMDLVDPTGINIWRYSYYDVKDFSDEDYDEFINEYEESNKDDEDKNEQKEGLKDSLETTFDNIKNSFKTFELEVVDIESENKLGEGLYEIKAKIKATVESVYEEGKESTTEVMSFVVYNNKIVYAEL